MENIVSYLQWRGDLSFWADPFNEVDNLILSYLSYFDFSGIVPGIDESKTLSVRKAADFYFQCTRKDNPFIEQEFLRVIAGTRRFGDVLLWKYEDIGDTENGKTQFAALHMILNDGTEYISFRGTDNSITGWREDFGMSYETVPAQKRRWNI